MHLKSLSLLLLIAAALGCTKQESFNAAVYAGNYKGTIEMVVNGSSVQQQVKEISFLPTMDYNSLEIFHNLLVTSIVTIDNNNFTIPPTVVGDNGIVRFVEYGSGSFDGDKVTIEFHQDQESIQSGTPLRTCRYKGVLERE
jgi:hypothetical protein